MRAELAIAVLLGALSGCGAALPSGAAEELDLIQRKAAAAAEREARANEQREAAIALAAQRQLEVARLEAGVAAAETLLARDRLRRHVESAIDEGRRRAAAAEERSGAASPNGALGEARTAIGRELLARARVEAAVLGALAGAGAALPEQRDAAARTVALAAEALAAGDLAQLQRRAEEVGADAHRAFAWAFEGAATPPAQRAEELRARLAGAGLEAAIDAYGVVVPLAYGAPGKRRGGCRGARKYEEIDAAVATAPRHAIVELEPRDGCRSALVLPLPGSP